MQSALIQKIIATNQSYPEIFENRSKIYTFLNPVSYLAALKNEDLFLRFDGIFVDGIFLALAIKLFYWTSVKRCSFDMTSLAPQLFSYSEIHEKSVYIVASHESEIERAIEMFRQQYPKLNIVGFHNGFFAESAEVDCEIKRILALSPDFVICGMGIVKQEKFLEQLKREKYGGVAFSCGGFISQTAKKGISYYPLFFDLLNLRFLYRMINEKHTRKRYLQSLFCFPILFMKDRLGIKHFFKANKR